MPLMVCVHAPITETEKDQSRRQTTGRLRMLARCVPFDELGQEEVEGVRIYGAFRREGGRLDLGVIGARGHDAAAAEAAHEQVLDDDVLRLVVAGEPGPEREPPDLE